MYVLNFYTRFHYNLRHFIIKAQMAEGKLQIRNCKKMVTKKKLNKK